LPDPDSKISLQIWIWIRIQTISEETLDFLNYLHGTPDKYDTSTNSALRSIPYISKITFHLPFSLVF
jgi:radical SAM superfamily enzyme